MSLMQKEAPHFEAEALYPDGTMQSLNLYDYRGKYVVLFFYPMDFTFVCPTEIIAFSDRIAEFHQRGADVLGVSVDSVHAHYAWSHMPRREGGIGSLTFPLISDLDKDISRRYDVLLDRPAVALRGTFLIDQKGIVRSAMVNDLPIGRNLEELLRLLDALREVEQHGEVCPATHDGLKEYAELNLA